MPPSRRSAARMIHVGLPTVLVSFFASLQVYNIHLLDISAGSSPFNYIEQPIPPSGHIEPIEDLVITDRRIVGPEDLGPGGHAPV